MNFSTSKRAGLVGLAVLLLVVLAISLGTAAAQDAPAEAEDFPVNTITVTGTGSAPAAPDMATIEVGAEIINPDIAAAFSESNTTIDAIIAAISAVGIAPEDIRTTNLSIYIEQLYGMPLDPASSTSSDGSTPARNYHVTNTVRVTVRDITLVEAVLNAAVGAGANNIYGLTFGVSDRVAVESQARINAMDDAQQRAAQLAEIAGGALGEVIVVNESTTGGGPFDALYNMAEGRGGGATIEPGSLSVQVQVQVTYRLNR